MQREVREIGQGVAGVQAMKAGRPALYTERLMFTPPASGNDPDRPVM